MAVPYIYFRGRRMTPAFRDAWLAAEQKCGWQIAMTQGGFNGNAVAASGGTHAGDSADHTVRNKTKAQVAREIECLRWAGIFSSFRTTKRAKWGVRAQGFSSYHGHNVPNGWGHPSRGAREQALAYRRGRDGLRGNGPDTGPGHTHASRTQTTPRRPIVTVVPKPTPKPAPTPSPPPKRAEVTPIPRHITPRPWMVIPVDGSLSGTCLSRLQWQLQIKPTGKLDHYTIRALKVWLGGASADDGTGMLRVIDVQRLQSRVGVTRDGKWGPATTRALQTYLNTHR